MTQTCRLAVREPVSDILPGAARLGLEPRTETLLCRAAFLYEWICDSLTKSCLKIKEPHRRHIAPDTAIGSLLLRPVPGRFLHDVPRARAVVCGFGMLPAHLGRASPYDHSAQNMENRVPRYPRANASHPAARTFNASSAPSGCSPEARGAWPTISPSRPRSATGRRPEDGFGERCRPSTA